MIDKKLRTKLNNMYNLSLIKKTSKNRTPSDSQNFKKLSSEFNKKGCMSNRDLLARYLDIFKVPGEGTAFPKNIFKIPLSQREIKENYGISQQNFGKKYLSRMFYIGLIFIFENKLKGINLVERYRKKWESGVGFYYMLIPETAEIVTMFEDIFELSQDYGINLSKVLPHIRNLVNWLGLYEVVCKIPGQKTDPLEGIGGYLDMKVEGKRIGGRYAPNNINSFFKKLGIPKEGEDKKLCLKLLDLIIPELITSINYLSKINLSLLIGGTFIKKSRGHCC